MPAVLLDSSFLIELEREIEGGQAGPAVRWLQQNRRRAARPLLVSAISVAEFLEGFDDSSRGLAFISHFVPQGLGFKQAVKCAELQRRARAFGRRLGENDAWQVAVAECAAAAIVGRDRPAFERLGKRYEQLERA